MIQCKCEQDIERLIYEYINNETKLRIKIKCNDGNIITPSNFNNLDNEEVIRRMILHFELDKAEFDEMNNSLILIVKSNMNIQ